MKKLPLCLLLSLALTANADDFYKVEVIVFQHLDPAAVGAEAWPAQPGTPALDQALELSALASAPAAVAAAQAPARAGWRALPAAQLTMGGAVQRLRNSARYRPLLHVGWVQPLDNADRGAAVHVFSGMTGARDDSVSQSLINGTIAVRRGRYLHADIDLVYKKDVTARLTHSRRLRSKEVHYIDHPLFGVILSVSPVEKGRPGGGSRPQ